MISGHILQFLRIFWTGQLFVYVFVSFVFCHFELQKSFISKKKLYGHIFGFFLVIFLPCRLFVYIFVFFSLGHYVLVLIFLLGLNPPKGCSNSASAERSERSINLPFLFKARLQDKMSQGKENENVNKQPTRSRYYKEKAKICVKKFLLENKSFLKLKMAKNEGNKNVNKQLTCSKYRQKLWNMP